jgi:hypothetical protein
MGVVETRTGLMRFYFHSAWSWRETRHAMLELQNIWAERDREIPKKKGTRGVVDKRTRNVTGTPLIFCGVTKSSKVLCAGEGN